MSPPALQRNKIMVARSFSRTLATSLAALCAGSALTFFPLHVGAAEGTFEEQMACTPDVFRLCASEIPDSDRIVECLNKKHTELSPECRKVIDTPEEPQKPHARK